MQKIILLILLSSVVVLSGCLAHTNRPTVRHEVETIPLTYRDKERIKDDIGRYLKDPLGAQYEDRYFVRYIAPKTNRVTTCAYVNARNSYGGYTGFSYWIRYDDDPRWIDASRFAYYGDQSVMEENCYNAKQGFVKVYE